MHIRISFSVLFLLCISCIYGQQSKMSMELCRLSQNKSTNHTQIGVLIQGNVAGVQRAVEQCGGHYKYHIGAISSVTIPADQLVRLASASFITRIEQGSIRLHPLNDTMVYLNNVVKVHNGVAPLSQAYDGKGIVCGFIDTGIDFTHPDFKDSLGKTRILYIWDQKMPIAANTPQPFNFGQEWTNIQIDSGKCTEVDTPYYGHGTRVAGTAAGNGRAVNRYAGVAPKADIIMVAVDFNNPGPTIADGAEYIFSKAKALGKPCVINCSLGSEMGSHDGTDLETKIIDSLVTAQPGRVFVGATGNSGNIAYHATNTLTNDSSFTWMRFNSNDTANGNTSMDVQIYGDSSSMKGLNFAIGADQVSPSYSFRGRTVFHSFSSQVGVMVYDTIFNNSNRVAVIQSYEQKKGNVYSIEYVVTPDSTYDNFRVITSGTGTFDAWCFQFFPGPLPSPVIYPPVGKCKLPDFDKTMETGFQCSPNVISVANYVNKNCFLAENDTVWCDTSFIFRPRRLAPSSGHGPTRTGLQKPDIAATGDYVISCMVMSQKQYFSPATQIGYGGMHLVGGGTSQSSPVITGIAALLLQQTPGATNLDIKTAITCSATQDVYTGSSLPDNKWGYGKANAFGAMTLCNPLATSELIKSTGNLEVWPNPFEESTTVSFEEIQGSAEFRVCDVLGREIIHFTVPEGTKSLTLPRSNMGSGIYFLTLDRKGMKSETRKIAVH